MEESGISGQLTVNPKELIIPPSVEKARTRAMNRRKNSTAKNGRKKNKLKLEDKISNINLNKIHFDEFVDEFENTTDFNLTTQWEYGKNLSYLTDERNQNIVENKEKWSDLRQSKPPLQKINIHDGFFCDSPSKQNKFFKSEVKISSLFFT